MLSETDKEHLRHIRDIRGQNNDVWMNILEIALIAAPQATKMVMRDVYKNDSGVIAHWKEICGE